MKEVTYNFLNTSNPVVKPDYIIQSNYPEGCNFWMCDSMKNKLEDQKGYYDIGVWKIKYKSVN